MALLAEQATETKPPKLAPRLTDAYTAASEIANTVPGVALVCVFGSVASNTATPDSDIDLLVVVKDLDCDQRLNISRRAEELVWETAKQESDVLVRSLTEWRERKHLASSFENVIDRTSLAIYESEDYLTYSEHDTHGEPMPNTNMFEAVNGLGELYKPLHSIPKAAVVDELEYKDLASAIIEHKHVWELVDNSTKTELVNSREARYAELFGQCDVVLEISLKSLHHSLGGAYPENTHAIHKLLAKIPEGETKSQLENLIQPLHTNNLPPEHSPWKRKDHPDPPPYTNWWIHSTYREENVPDARYLPTQRVLAYMSSSAQVAQIAFNTCAQDTKGYQLIMGHKQARDVPVVLDMLSRFLASTDLEMGTSLASKPATDIDKLLSATKKGKILDPRTRQSLRQIAGQIQQRSPSIMSGRKCGAQTDQGKPCKNPHPGSGRRCSAGHRPR